MQSKNYVLQELSADKQVNVSCDDDEESIETVYDEARDAVFNQGGNLDNNLQINSNSAQSRSGESFVPETPKSKGVDVSVSGAILSTPLGDMPIQMQKDMSVISKLWSDQVELEAVANQTSQANCNVVEEQPFEVVLSKSQRKKKN